MGTVSASSPRTAVYTPKRVIPHAALLRQACAHCGKFLAAASRRSRGRVSVPVWLAVLSDQLPITATVGRHPAVKLIGRRRLPGRGPKAPFLILPTEGPTYAELPGVSAGCPPPRGSLPTRYAPVRHESAPKGAPSDLHALGTPPALILSQDQTLHQCSGLRKDPDPVGPSLRVDGHAMSVLSHKLACICCARPLAASTLRKGRTRRVPRAPSSAHDLTLDPHWKGSLWSAAPACQRAPR